MFKEIILSTILSTSFSIQTSNEESKPYDYEFMIKAEYDSKHISYLIESELERELGNKYRNNLFKINYIDFRNIYYGFDFISKETKHIEYFSFNCGYRIKENFQTGLSIKYQDIMKTDILAHIEYKNILNRNKTNYLISLSAKSDFNDNNIFDITTDIKTWITDNINLFFMVRNIYFSNKEDFQFKVGLGYKFK